MQGHGENEPRPEEYFTMGYMEAVQVAAAVEWLQRTDFSDPQPICCMGFLLAGAGGGPNAGRPGPGG